MQPTGGTNGNSGALPPRETWYPARRRLHASMFAALALLLLIVNTIEWFTGDGREPSELPLALIYVGQAITFAVLAWIYARVRLEADAEGLHLVQPLRRTTYPWEDIAEIRPSILKGKKTYLVLVRRNRQIVDLPLTEKHLDELRRWHQAAT